MAMRMLAVGVVTVLPAATAAARSPAHSLTPEDCPVTEAGAAMAAPVGKAESVAMKTRGSLVTVVRVVMAVTVDTAATRAPGATGLAGRAVQVEPPAMPGRVAPVVTA